MAATSIVQDLQIIMEYGFAAICAEERENDEALI